MSAASRTAPHLSGSVVELTHGPYHAEIATIGASLRRLRYDGRDLVVPFDADEVRPAFRGAILAPWPNRVVDGRYTFDGHEHQLALTEPERGHALHGLVAWVDFDASSTTADRAVLTTSIPAQVGYPFPVDVRVEYVLGDGGLTTTVTGTNRGDVPAPWGTAPHPYLVAGDGRVDDWTITLPADTVLEVTPDRLVPTRLASVVDAEAGGFDLRGPTRIGERFVDHAFTDLTRDADGFVEVRLTAGAGGAGAGAGGAGAREGAAAGASGVVMRWDRACAWVQVHTADHVVPEYHRVGLAVEPMTCAPDAFNSGLGLTVLAPAGSAAASWTIGAITG